MTALLLFLLGFASGSVLYSALLPRLLKGVDVHALAPDHNPGAANVFIYAGVPVGILALLCDLAKAYLPVWFALRWLDMADPAFGLVLCAPVLGHAFSPFARFRGGKAIAASFGALLALLPGCGLVWHLAFWYVLLSTAVILRPHAVRTILTFILVVLAAMRMPLQSVTMGMILIAAAVTWRHLPTLRAQPFALLLFGRQVLPTVSKQPEPASSHLRP